MISETLLTPKSIMFYTSPLEFDDAEFFFYRLEWTIVEVP